EDVLDPELARLLEVVANLFAGGSDASQMGHGRQPVLALNPVDDPQGFVARTAAGSVSDGAEVGFELQQLRQRRFEEGAFAFVGLWREELEGDDRAVSCVSGRMDVSDKLHANRIGKSARITSQQLWLSACCRGRYDRGKSADSHESWRV